MIKRVEKLKEQGGGGSLPHINATITEPSRERKALGSISASWCDILRKENRTLGPPQVLVKLKLINSKIPKGEK